MNSSNRPLPRLELMRQVRKFLADKNRGISINLFAELCGLGEQTIKDVFIHQSYPVSEYVQIRTSKGYASWQKGQVAVMQNRDNTRFVSYRKEAKPVMVRTTGLQVVNGEIRIKVGISNKADYSGKTLDETIGRG